MLDFLRRKPRPGTPYDGPVAYNDGPDVGHVPGYYALTDGGKQLRAPLVRCCWVDHAPGDDEDGAGHYEIAHRADGSHRYVPPPGSNVDLETLVEGHGGITA